MRRVIFGARDDRGAETVVHNLRLVADRVESGELDFDCCCIMLAGSSDDMNIYAGINTWEMSSGLNSLELIGLLSKRLAMANA